MGSRVFILLGLMLAVVLLISSEVAARDLAAQTETAKTNGVEESKYGGGGYNNGGGGYNNGGGGYNNGGGGYNNGGGRYGGGGGRYGGGGGGRYGGGGGGRYGGGGHGGGCRHGYCHGRCCTYAGEAKDAQTTAKPQN